MVALFTGATIFAYNPADYPIIVPWASKPYCPYYDTVELAAELGMTVDINGVPTVPTHENCIGKPETMPLLEDWNNIENWVTFPVSVQIPKVSIAEGENPYYGRTYNDNERGRTGFRKFVAAKDNKILFPPIPYPTFELIPRKSCKLGTGEHIFGANCKCRNCDATREHFYDSPTDTQCARCVNEYDEYKLDDDGNEVPTGKTTGQKCGAKITKDSSIEYQDFVELHSGWREEETDSDEYNCSCECGYYAFSNVKLAHWFPENNKWQQTNKDGLLDEVYHWKKETCQRCEEAEKWISEEHAVSNVVEDARQEGDSIYLDFSYHQAPGVCDKCGHKGIVRESHTYADEKSCYCKYCGEYVHNWTELYCGGFMMGHKCARCGQCCRYSHSVDVPPTYNDKLDANNEGRDYHTWADVIYIVNVPDPRKHQCKCGQIKEDHTFNDEDECIYCDFKLNDDNNTPTGTDMDDDGSRGVNCVKQGKPMLNHLGIKASTTHFDATCPASNCGAVFADNPLGSGSDRSTFKKRAAELGVDSIDDMPMRAYVKYMTPTTTWMARMNWVTKRNYDLLALHDTWGWATLDDVLTRANAAMDLVYENGVGGGNGSMTLCLNAFGVERPVTNSFTGKITTTIDYSPNDTFIATGTAKEKTLHRGVYIQWK